MAEFSNNSFDDRRSRLTENITVISHVHGRDRRQERNIDKKELQAAIKHGVKTAANPGRDGSQRWCYTYNGIVYLSDATSKHEITSWRENDTEKEAIVAYGPADVNNGSYSSHIVLVVDCSGSMRTPDVSGFSTRTAAVYECIAREFIEPQLALLSAKTASTDTGSSVVSLIEMGSEAIVRLHQVPITESLLVYLRERRESYATSHGNYLPALESLRALMLPDLNRPVQLMAVFLSDGAPSDHVFMECQHGVNVWRQELGGAKGQFGRGKGSNDSQLAMSECSDVKRCRQLIRQSVTAKCVELVKAMGDEFGRDRIRLHTVAFGPPDEDYQVLEAMAKVLPRSSFQKLGLAPASLRSAISFLSSNFSSLRSETTNHNTNNNLLAAMGRNGITRRVDLDAINPDIKSDLRREPGIKISRTEFEKISVYQIMAMWVWDQQTSNLIDTISASKRLDGHYIGKRIKYFSKGAEHAVFECQELIVRNQTKNVQSKFDKSTGTVTVSRSYVRNGPRKVAKESLFVEPHQMNLEMYRAVAEIQAIASEYARCFNAAVRSHPQWSPWWSIYVLNCCIYEVIGISDSPRQQDKLSGNNWLLTEAELEGRFTKWNNNAGMVYLHPSPPITSSLGAIVEENEEGDEVGHKFITENDVIQAFSHFTLRMSEGKELVCDLQGIYNTTDGFTLTDPTINSARGKGTKGLTDRGQEGIDKFRQTHVCSDLCRWLHTSTEGAQHSLNPLSSPFLPQSPPLPI